MFRVDRNNLEDYLAFDPQRRMDLLKLDKLIRASAPRLKRYFHRGTPEGEPGMRFQMIGYGRFYYRTSNGTRVEWPAVGVALQKNYISVYLSVKKSGAPLIESYRGKLGEFRFGGNSFSFIKYEDLDALMVSNLFAEAERLFDADTLGLEHQPARSLRH